MLKRTLSAIAFMAFGLGLGASFPDPAYAMKQKGDLLVRVRAVHFAPVADGTTDAGGDADVSHDNIPELDFTYFFTDNIAAELILATTRHKVNVRGVADLGKVSIIPPVLTLQYHFNPKGKFSPYVGWSINFDVKKVFVDTDIKVNGPSVTGKGIDLDPWILSVGVGYRF